MGYTIRAARESDMEVVCEVHAKCFPESFSTRLGKNLLTKYYLEFYREAPHLFLVCENDEGKMCGFVMGYVLGKTNAISILSFISSPPNTQSRVSSTAQRLKSQK